MQPDNLLSLKDDMVAFIEGHGMRRFPGFVGEDVPSILWEGNDNPDSWKDFVEMAKTASSAFLTMSDGILEKRGSRSLDRNTSAIRTSPMKKLRNSTKCSFW